MDYNVIVVGAGSAGLVSAYICAAVKAKVLLIEKNKMGGDCLNTGCVPSKALIRSAHVASLIKRHKEFGIKHAECEIDFAQVMERIGRVVGKIEPHDSVERYTKLGVDCRSGDAKILSANKVSVDGRAYTAKKIIIATGAEPFIPSIEGLKDSPYLTTETVWNLRQKPRHMVVLGGGPIGCELGQSFARLGVKVTQIELADQLLLREDGEVIEIMRKRFMEDGVEVITGASPQKVSYSDGNYRIEIETKEGSKIIECDQLLVAVGRKARVKGFGLEELGAGLTDKGLLKVDTYSQTTVRGIYACGDVCSPYQFTHTAAHQAWYCAVNALFEPLKRFKVDWSVIPWCTYTDPEIARVGLNEKDARQKGIAYEVSCYGLDDLDRAIADEEDKGLVKVLTKPGTDKILGVTICGHHAGDLLPGFVYAMKYNIGLNKILGSIHPYPSMGEANKYVAGVWKKAHAPEGLLKALSFFHKFRRR